MEHLVHAGTHRLILFALGQPLAENVPVADLFSPQDAAPFDAILVTAAAPRIPAPLKEQLKEGGRLVLPVGDDWQELVVVTRRGERFEEKRVLPVRFVPMTGKVRQ